MVTKAPLRARPANLRKASEALRWLRRTLVAFAMATAGCGGSPPTAPTAPAALPTPAPQAAPGGRFEVTDGFTGAPVGAGQVSVGEAATSFADVFTVGSVGSTAVIIVPGFLRRELTLPESGRVTLWPAQDAAEAEYTRRLVYISALDNSTERPMFRLPIGAYSIALGPEVDTADVRAVLERVFSRIRDLTRGAVDFRIGASAPLATLSIDPSVAPFAGFTSWASFGGYIATGAVRVVSAARARDEALLLHEFGHLVGLNHSLSPEDVMNPAARVVEPSGRERRTAALLFQRSAGARFPDSDGSLAFRGLAETATQFSCGR